MKTSAILHRSTPAHTTLRSLLLVVLLLVVHPAHAATRTVTNLNDSGAGSLRNTIAAAAAGDIITFTVTGTITLSSGELVISRNLTFLGPAGGHYY